MIDILHSHAIIQWIQQFHNASLDYFFLFITRFGNKAFYVAAIAFLYLCVDKKFAVKLFYLFSIGVICNCIIKDYYALPRPDQTKVRAVMKYSARGYSFPSGHAQGPLAFWGFCLTRFRAPLFVVCAAFMIVAVPFSRLYLGVHFPLDILGGLIVGAATIVLFFVLYRALERFPLRRYYWAVVAALTAAPMIGFFAFTESREMAQLMGALAGFGAGSFLEARYVRFDVQGGVLLQTVKMVACFAVGALILAAFGALPFKGSTVDFAANLAAGGWVSCGLPFCVRILLSALRRDSGANGVIGSERVSCRTAS